MPQGNGAAIFNYPAKFTPEVDGGCSVTFRDMPEAITQGDTLAAAFGALGRQLDIRVV